MGERVRYKGINQVPIAIKGTLHPGTKEKIEFRFKRTLPLVATESYSGHLQNFTGIHNFPNIFTGVNDAFMFGNGLTFKTLKIPQGGYSLEAIIKVIDEFIIAGGDETAQDKKIKIDVIYETLKVRIRIAEGYGVNLAQKNSIAPLLGFNRVILHGGTHYSTNTVILNGEQYLFKFIVL